MVTLSLDLSGCLLSWISGCCTIPRFPKSCPLLYIVYWAILKLPSLDVLSVSCRDLVSCRDPDKERELGHERGGTKNRKKFRYRCSTLLKSRGSIMTELGSNLQVVSLFSKFSPFHLWYGISLLFLPKTYLFYGWILDSFHASSWKYLSFPLGNYHIHREQRQRKLVKKGLVKSEVNLGM